MLACARAPCATQPPLVLEHVVPERVREPGAEHEAAQCVPRPRHDAVLIGPRAGGAEVCFSLIGDLRSAAPGRTRLVIQDDVAGRDVATGGGSPTRRWCRHELDGREAVIDL